MRECGLAGENVHPRLDFAERFGLGVAMQIRDLEGRFPCAAAPRCPTTRAFPARFSSAVEELPGGRNAG